MIPIIGSKLLIALLKQDEVNSIKKQYGLTKEQILVCNEADPSSKNTYTRWLCKAYRDTEGTEAEKENSVTKLKAPLTQFMKLVNSPEFPKEKRDIGKYTVEALLAIVGNQRRYLKQLSPTAIEKLIKTEGLPGAKIVWDGNGFRMWYITNFEYAMILGSNTHWCTASSRDYAIKYTTQGGGLYIIYLNGKPYCQGHFDVGDWEFLDVNDKCPNLLDSEVQRMFTAIQHPIMAIFKKICDGKFAGWIDNFSNEELEEKKTQLITYAEDSQNILTVGPIVKKIWWPEGWELLLDSPNFLLKALDGLSSDLKRRLRDSDLTEEVADICMKKGRGEWALFFGGPTQIQKYVASVFNGDDATSGNVFRSLSAETKEEIEKEGIRYVSEMTSPISLNTANTLDNLQYLGKKVLLAYWSKFLNRKWDIYHRLLQAFPEYGDRVNQLARVRRKIEGLSEGDMVEPGPDCPSKFAKGQIVSIDGISVVVKLKEGNLQTFVQNDERGIYQLQKVGNEELKYFPIVIIDKTEETGMKAGMRVIPGRENNKPGDGYYHGDYGDIIRIVENSCQVKWEDGTEANYYWPDPDWLIPAVASSDPRALCNWEKEKSEGSEALKIGDLVMARVTSVYSELGECSGIILSINYGEAEVRSKDGGLTTMHVQDLLKITQKEKTWYVASPQPEILVKDTWVTRGPDWHWGDQDTLHMTREEIDEYKNLHNEMILGRVLVPQTGEWVSVKWPDSNQNSYKFTEENRDILAVEQKY